MTIVVDPAMRRRVVLSSTLGNALEWFDFTVFGLFAGIIGKLFFPSSDPASSLLLTFATFGVAFAARPFGGVVFGMFADKYGRKRTLVTMIFLMALGTGLIGVLPTYAAIGIVAPLMIFIARLIQGFSAGGEFGSASAMLIEFAPPGRRGLYGSWQVVSQSIAFALGASMAFTLTKTLSPSAFESWGWRVPFLLGIVIGPVGIYLRHRCDESPEFKQHLEKGGNVERMPLGVVLETHKRELAVVFCMIAAVTAINYVGSVFMPIFAASELKLSLADAQAGLIVVSLLSAFIAPLSGALSDRIGRPRIIGALLIVYSALYFTMMTRLVAFPSRSALWQLQACGLLLGMMAGPMPAMLTEIFPVGVRATGASLMYNLAVMLFGGLAPFTNTWLVKTSANKAAPALYILFAAAIGLMGLVLHRGLSRPSTASASSRGEKARRGKDDNFENRAVASKQSLARSSLPADFHDLD